MYVPLNAAGPQPVPVARPSSSEFELPNYRTPNWYPATRSWTEIGHAFVTKMRDRSRDWYPAIRDWAELFITLILLIPAAIAIAVAALAVRLTSRGPVVFKQIRVGLDGQEFEILKIRSMTHDCERKSGAVWSQKGDPRVTNVGKVLRRLHIDELPQLWNVLRREMSLIGPRPERPVFVAKLEKTIDRYRERLKVRPGVTGLAQVQLPPDSDEADVQKKQAYDLYYIDKMNLWMDVRILLATGLKMVCVPYSCLTKVFGMPSEQEVFHFSWESSADVAETEDEIAQVQTA